MIKWPTVSAALILLISLSGCASKIARPYAYIDIKDVLIQTEAGKKAKGIISVQIEEYEKQIKIRKEKIYSLKLKLENDHELLDDNSKKDIKKRYQTELDSFQQWLGEANKSLKEMDKKYTYIIIKKLFDITMDMQNNSNKYQAVFEAGDGEILSGVIIGDRHLKIPKREARNITPEMIDRMNADLDFLDMITPPQSE